MMDADVATDAASRDELYSAGPSLHTPAETDGAHGATSSLHARAAGGSEANDSEEHAEGATGLPGYNPSKPYVKTPCPKLQEVLQ